MSSALVPAFSVTHVALYHLANFVVFWSLSLSSSSSSLKTIKHVKRTFHHQQLFRCSQRRPPTSAQHFACCFGRRTSAISCRQCSSERRERHHGHHGRRAIQGCGGSADQSAAADARPGARDSGANLDGAAPELCTGCGAAECGCDAAAARSNLAEQCADDGLAARSRT